MINSMTEVFQNRTKKYNTIDEHTQHIGYDDITQHIQKIKTLLQEIDKGKEGNS